MTRANKVEQKRAEVLAQLSPAQKEIYVCFAGTVGTIYKTPLMPDVLAALKGFVSVLEVYCEKPEGDGKEEHY